MSLIEIAKRELLSAREQAARKLNAALPLDRIVFYRPEARGVRRGDFDDKAASIG
jgi:hypothetical protein